MRKLMPQTLRNAHGMTLVEILIVLAIIGGIFALIGTKVNDGFQKASQRGTNILMGQIASAINVYSADCGKIPQALNDLIQSPGDGECSSWGPAYLKPKQIKDAWNHDFVYQAENGTFTLKSLGKDGREGGSNFDKDLVYDDGEGTEK